MQRVDSVLRWLGAVGITLAPLGIFVLPTLINPETHETAEEQFRAIAEGTTNGYPAQLMQIAGAVFFMAAVLGIGGHTIARGRGGTLGAIGLITGMVGAISMLVVLGFELALLIVLIDTPDTDAAVNVVAATYDGPEFITLLVVGLVGFFLTLPILGLALWRSRVVPIIVPLLFALPLLVNFIPLPANVSSTIPSLLLLVPCVWMAVQLIRDVPGGVRPIATATAPPAAQKDEVDT